jgi:hypothetical protein
VEVVAFARLVGVAFKVMRMAGLIKDRVWNAVRR